MLIYYHRRDPIHHIGTTHHSLGEFHLNGRYFSRILVPIHALFFIVFPLQVWHT